MGNIGVILGSWGEHAAKVLAQLMSGKRFQTAATAIASCTTEKQVDEKLQEAQVQQPFLRYLLYRDIQQYFPQLPDWFYVGNEAQHMLKEAAAVCKPKLATSRGCSTCKRICARPCQTSRWRSCRGVGSTTTKNMHVANHILGLNPPALNPQSI